MTDLKTRRYKYFRCFLAFKGRFFQPLSLICCSIHYQCHNNNPSLVKYNNPHKHKISLFVTSILIFSIFNSLENKYHNFTILFNTCQLNSSTLKFTQLNYNDNTKMMHDITLQQSRPFLAAKTRREMSNKPSRKVYPVVEQWKANAPFGICLHNRKTIPVG